MSTEGDSPSKYMCTTFVQRRPNVFDVGPTLYNCYTNFVCLPCLLRGALCDRRVACSALHRQGLNLKTSLWRAVTFWFISPSSSGSLYQVHHDNMYVALREQSGITKCLKIFLSFINQRGKLCNAELHVLSGSAFQSVSICTEVSECVKWNANIN